MRVEGLLDQLVAAPDLFDFDGADLGSTKAQLQFPVRRAPETGRTDDLAVAFVHALRKGQEQGQQAYLFPDALIKLEEQRDFLGGPLTVEERQRRYELDFAFRETEQFRIADQIVAVRVVVRKGNEDPDVVQQGGIVQQLARYGRGVVQPDGPRAVEQFKGQLRDVPGMFFLEAAEPCQLEDAFLAGGEAGTGLLRMRPHEVVDEDAVLQVAVADGHALESLLLHDGLEDGRARDDHVGPVGIDARNGFTLLKGPGTQFLDRAAQAVIAEDMLGSRGGFARARGEK